MRIGIDATCWWSRRGFGRFTRGLLDAMFNAPDGHEFVLFLDRPPEPEMLRPGVSIVQVDVSRTVTVSAVAGGSRSLSDIHAFKRAVAKQALDVMFFPAVYSWFPVKRSLPVVVTLHDAIAERFPELVFPDRKGRMLWALKMRLACWQATRFITVSHAAKREIVEFLRLGPDEIDVITEAADPMFQASGNSEKLSEARARAGLPEDDRMIVYVGGLAPHKNIAGFMQAFARITGQPGVEDLHLVLIGDVEGDGFHSHYQELNELRQTDQRLAGRVHFTGFVSDEDLVTLMAGSVALCLPSFSEGFGLPAIEAMACGIPVLASSAGSLPEVVGDAGLLFDPHDIAAMSAAILDISTNAGLRSELQKRALQRSSQFSWATAAQMVFPVLQATVDA
jgi:glycosyltransferase involved in cell wall biosynthesis